MEYIKNHRTSFVTWRPYPRVTLREKAAINTASETVGIVNFLK